MPQSQLNRAFVATVWSAFRVKGSRLRIRLILVLGLLFGVALFQISNLALALPITTASRVYGQLGNFNTGGSNLQYPSNTSLYYPYGVAVDPNGGLYIVDTGNYRVLHYPSGSRTADRVYGQLGSFATSTANKGGISANSFSNPYSVAVDSSGGLYVSDISNNRVLHFPADGNTTADRVYGQFGSFTSGTTNKGGISADSLNGPDGMTIDPFGGLYLADTYNNRVLHYPTGSTTADRVYGQLGSFSTGNPIGISADSLTTPYGVILDPTGGLYISDSGNNRILHYPINSTTADRVYGQLGNFTTGGFNKGGRSANSFYFPYTVVVDSIGGLYVSDASNNRVLHFPADGSTTADRVYGQHGDFTTDLSNNGGRSADTFYFPLEITLDSTGGLYVADSSNNRVLHFSVGSTTADGVYGQLGSFTAGAVNNNGGINANSLNGPIVVEVDATGGIYVADTFNNRVLHYPMGSTTADRVYGQLGSFFSNTANKGGISANSLSAPNGLAIDSSGGLYISDQSNHRVLHYPANSTTADLVYGQLGSFTTGTFNNGGISANSLCIPRGLAVDPNGGLYVADIANNRVLHYPAGSTTADRVYGQFGNFSSNTSNNGGISANSMFSPNRVVVDPAGGLYVTDNNNNRVLHFSMDSTTADRVYGQLGSFSSNTANKGGISANSLSTPNGLAVNSAGDLYISDQNNNRVLHYSSEGNTTADGVYGQLGSFSSNIANNGGISADNLNNPGDVAVDRTGSLYIADFGNNRVLFYTNITIPTTVTLESNPNSSTFGQSVAFTVTVVPATAIGTVTFTEGVTTLGTGTLSNGVATLSLVSLSVGSHDISAIYDGDSNYTGSSSNMVTQVVNQAATAVSLTSASNPSIFGQSVTFTATVSPISASGTVTFTEGAATLGTGTLANGIVTFSTSSLSVGSHDISATYGGDNSYIGSSSNTIHQVVNQASTSLTLTSLPNPSTFGQSVSFTATISPLMASGTVTFTESGSILGTGTLSAGVATFSITNLPIGSHVISATYGGDSSYAGSVSNTVEQVVNSDCEPLVVNSNTDNGAGTICGTFSYALMQVSPGMTITFAFTQSNTITFTGALTPTVKSGVTIDGGSGVGGIVLYGNGVAGDGLQLMGQDTLINLTIRRFAGRELVTLGPGNVLKHVVLQT
jgi:sugar lactone lactonase YvrE